MDKDGEIIYDEHGEFQYAEQGQPDDYRAGWDSAATGDGLVDPAIEDPGHLPARPSGVTLSDEETEAT